MTRLTIASMLALSSVLGLASTTVFETATPTPEPVIGDFLEIDSPQDSRPDDIAKEREEELAKIKKMIEGREKEPAEKVFKNVEILKGRAAGRLPAMMAALTESLGVGCSHCHVSDKWESEEKAAKKTARKMFEMTGAINKDHFAGKNKVSCWTCHRGNPNPPIQKN